MVAERQRIGQWARARLVPNAPRKRRSYHCQRNDIAAGVSSADADALSHSGHPRRTAGGSRPRVVAGRGRLDRHGPPRTGRDSLCQTDHRPRCAEHRGAERDRELEPPAQRSRRILPECAIRLPVRHRSAGNHAGGVRADPRAVDHGAIRRASVLHQLRNP